MDPLHVRGATADDYPAFERFFAELGVPDPTPSVDQFLAAHVIFLAPPDARAAPLAYGCWATAGADAHVRHVVVDAQARGRGIGKQLLAALAERIRGEGASRWHLYMKEDNLPALRLYRSFGMEISRRTNAFEMPWERVTALPPSRRRLAAAAPQPAFAVEAEELATWQADPDSRVVCLTDEADQPAALARFMPSFPGARPFITDGADAARPLLEALERWRRPTDPAVRLLLDEQPETCAALRAAGARHLLALVRMDGPLPG